MKIWQLLFDVDKYENLVPKNNFVAEEIQSFDGTPQKETWQPLKVKRMEPEKSLELSDAPGFIIPVFSEKALKVLYPAIQNSVEVLDLDFIEKKYYAINVTTVLNVIDYSKSEYKTFSDGKKILAFQKYVFKECEELYKNNIFKIIDEKRRKAFVSDIFKNIVETNNLSGFIFKLVWDSDET